MVAIRGNGVIRTQTEMNNHLLGVAEFGIGGGCVDEWVSG